MLSATLAATKVRRSDEGLGKPGKEDGAARAAVKAATDHEVEALRHELEEAKARLQEIVLRGAGQQFSLSFSFGDEPAQESAQAVTQAADAVWPQYVLLQQDGGPTEGILPPDFSQTLGTRERALTQPGVSL
jgi:hypothetical protein